MGKKVCHFSSVHRVNDIRVFHKECRTLTTGYDVSLVACPAEVPSGSGVSVITLQSKGGRLRRMLTGALNAYSAAKAQKADLYHFHDPELLPYGLLLKTFTGARVVYDSHECYPDDILTKEWIPLPLRKVIASAFRVLEDFVVKRLDLVVAATSHIEERFKPVARRTVTINNYPLLEEFVQAQSQEVAKDGFCYVGAISHVRGILPLMDSLDFVDRGIRFYLAGTFASADIEAQVKGHRNWDRVTYLGQVSRREISEVYSKSFAGIVNFLPAPNHIYSQPNKLFEYMSAGIPVVCSNFDLWRSVVETGECGICVDPSSPRALAEAVNAIHGDSSLWSAYSSNGRRLIEEKYSWNREGQRLLQSYDEVLAL
ncbi:WbpH [Cupriavidus taiwanensis]|uniref:glycosyltransferase family 4 protein n=1 Tax=Cupriavidus taiwanensis TaxID=164546 RepID=UPI000E191BEF|nr:glycosyltransferase family 4 protein [Cupriavidus taiwanensis]SOY82778.1 WbpH [Cupriavidus taiwanensis]SOY84530.1 WbpH [Cupriavidus taiwanensis]